MNTTITMKDINNKIMALQDAYIKTFDDSVLNSLISLKTLKQNIIDGETTLEEFNASLTDEATTSPSQPTQNKQPSPQQSPLRWAEYYNYKWTHDIPDPLGQDEYGRNKSWVKDRDDYLAQPHTVITKKSTISNK